MCSARNLPRHVSSMPLTHTEPHQDTDLLHISTSHSLHWTLCWCVVPLSPQAEPLFHLSQSPTDRTELSLTNTLHGHSRPEGDEHQPPFHRTAPLHLRKTAPSPPTHRHTQTLTQPTDPTPQESAAAAGRCTCSERACTARPTKRHTGPCQCTSTHLRIRNARTDKGNTTCQGQLSAQQL